MTSDAVAKELLRVECILLDYRSGVMSHARALELLAQPEAAGQDFDAWYDTYPDQTEYMQGMRDAFEAGKRAAQPAEVTAEQEADWWHREWHRATGIPCDGSEQFCPKVKHERR